LRNEEIETISLGESLENNSSATFKKLMGFNGLGSATVKMFYPFKTCAQKQWCWRFLLAQNGVRQSDNSDKHALGFSPSHRFSPLVQLNHHNPEKLLNFVILSKTHLLGSLGVFYPLGSASD